MFGEMNIRVELVEVVKHPHVQIVIMHRRVSVFGHDRIQRNISMIGFGQRESRHDLSKNLLLGSAAINFVDVADRHFATGIGVRGVFARQQPILICLPSSSFSRTSPTASPIPAAVSFWRIWSKSSVHPTLEPSCAEVRSSPRVSSRYDSFCRPAREATSASISPLCARETRPKRPNVAKK